MSSNSNAGPLQGMTSAMCMKTWSAELLWYRHVAIAGTGDSQKRETWQSRQEQTDVFHSNPVAYDDESAEQCNTRLGATGTLLRAFWYRHRILSPIPAVFLGY